MAAVMRHLTRKLSSAARQTQLSTVARDGCPPAAALVQQPFSPQRNRHRHHLPQPLPLHPHRQPCRRRHFTANPITAAAAAAAGIASDDDEVLQSIVKVFTVSCSPNFFLPWQNKTQGEKTGSGVVMLLPLFDVPNGICVLTNAHVVSDQTFVQVRRHGSSVKFQARVYAVGHDCDLAVLTVDDPKFFADSTQPISTSTSAAAAPAAGPGRGDEDDDDGPTNQAAAAPSATMTTAATAIVTTAATAMTTAAVRQVRPPPMGDVPHLQEQVSVMGFPSGGDNLSITSGVVSRVELTNYVHGAAELLAIQLDAAINPGNSGGPALQGGKMVGLAFQNLPGMDNIGYVIPTPIIRRFLHDIETDAGKTRKASESKEENQSATERGVGSLTWEVAKNQSRTLQHAGFCTLGVKCQALDNPALRSYFGMLPSETGVLITSVTKMSPSCGLLKVNDLLLEVDGELVANDGTVSFRGWERVAFDHLISLKKPWQSVKLKVRRRVESDEVSAKNTENTKDTKDTKDTVDAEKTDVTESESERESESKNKSESETDAESKGEVRAVGDAVESEVITVRVRVRPRTNLVPVHQYDRLPSYYVFAGLVFSQLTQPLLHEWGDDWYNQSPRRLCERALNDDQEVAGEEVVVLSQVLADEVNAGYQGMQDVEVNKVDGKDIRSMRQLKEAVEGARGEFLRVDLRDCKVLVLNLKEAREAHDRIMAKHRVPYNMSRDLM